MIRLTKARSFPLSLILIFTHVAEARPRHVIVVGIDGLGAAGVREGKIPHIRSLMARGMFTLRARGVIPTVSSPNWASMIMGAGPAQHGVVTNEWEVHKHEIEPICHGSAKTFPTIFGILRQQKPNAKIAVFHDWEGFGRLVEPGAATVQQHVKGSPGTMEAATSYWNTEKPDLMFIHLDDVDHAGHEYGWGGAQYREAVEMIDDLLGRLLKTVAESGLDQKTAIVLSADHGGTGRKHGANSTAELEIPWIAAGPGIPQNRELAPAVNTYDTAATVAELLGLRAPACWIGRPVSAK